MSDASLAITAATSPVATMFAAVLAGAGPQVDDVVGGAHHGVVMFDHDHGVAHVAQSGQGPDETVIVVGMQARRWVRRTRTARR